MKYTNIKQKECHCPSEFNVVDSLVQGCGPAYQDR